MVEIELLIRTMNAAKKAREKDFVNTAEALDEIVAYMLAHANAKMHSSGENCAYFGTDLPQLH